MRKKCAFICALLILMSLYASSVSAQLISPGKLTKSHGKIEGLTNCIKCHKLAGGISDSACLSCHEKLVERIKHKKGFHAELKDKCITCHTDHKGENYDIMQFNMKSFDHSKTGYVLEDKHKINCNKCHKKEKTYLGLSTECISCHTDVHKKTLSEDCSKCHNFAGWKEMKFDHDKKSEYKLTGKHIEVKCEGCHPRYSIIGKSGETEKEYKVFKFKPLEYKKCNDCHTDIHKGKLKEQSCKSCHTTKGWRDKPFDHNNAQLSEYKLEGKHVNVSCELCHPEEKTVYEINGKPVVKLAKRLKPVKHGLCSDCHYDVHKGQLKDQKCAACHTVQDEWKKNTFKHESGDYKGYKLEGKHKEVECDLCHPRTEITFKEFNKGKKVAVGTFVPVKSELCSDCHYDVHKGQFKDWKCEACHTVQNEWKKNTFKHESGDYKGYKLEGKHKDVECNLCHPRTEITFKEFNKGKKVAVGTFVTVKSEQCSDCHYDVHKGQFKDQKCAACHTVQDEWKKNTFKHESEDYRGYKLIGKHAAVKCELCHVRSKIEFKEFNKGKKVSVGKFKPIEYKKCITCHKDIHKGKYEQECKKCHTPYTWEPTEFLHDPLSFELKGSHRVVTCKECHKVALAYKGLDSSCVQCHKDPHLNQFGLNCNDCHGQAEWIPVSYTHHSYQVRGIHNSIDCIACHQRGYPGDYVGLAANNCYECHTTEYQSAANHLSSGYSQDCTDCHSLSGTWKQTVTFSHPTFNFRGAHLGLKNDCAKCHGTIEPQAGTTDDDCYNCHSTSGMATTKYEGVSSPSHVALGYSTSCTDCHTESAWSPASSTHQSYQLTGLHSSLSCESCHQSGYPGQFAGASEDDCYTCHMNDYQSAANHVSSGYPQDCTACHSSSKRYIARWHIG
jgi:hypothetical protein